MRKEGNEKPILFLLFLSAQTSETVLDGVTEGIQDPTISSNTDGNYISKI